MSGEGGLNDIRTRLDLLSSGGGSVAWANVTGKPSTFTPSAHDHVIADVPGLQTALDGKQAAGSYQPLATVLTNTTAAFTSALETKLGGIATGATANSSDATLLARANHTGAQAAATITGLSALATSTDAAGLTGNVAVARLNGGTGATASTFWRGDGTWATPAGGGGSDPWTYIKLASDFPTSLATFSDITGMTFTPAANTDYEVEWCLHGQTATTTVGVRQGVSYGTGYQYGSVDLYTPTSATAEGQVHGSMTTVAGTVQAAVGGLPIVNRTYGHRGYAVFRSGATPTAFKLQLASETAATAVTVKAGSFIKYRTI